MARFVHNEKSRRLSWDAIGIRCHAEEVGYHNAGEILNHLLHWVNIGTSLGYPNFGYTDQAISGAYEMY